MDSKKDKNVRTTLRMKRLNIEQIKVNPEYKTLVPPLTTEEYQDLKQNIIDEGLIYPLILNTVNVVLDGHHRLEICQEININYPNVIRKEFGSVYDEKKFVITSNLHRRQLTTAQKSVLGLKLLEIEKEKAKERQGERTDLKKDSNIRQNFAGSSDNERKVDFDKAIAPHLPDKPKPTTKKPILKEKGKAVDKAAEQVGISGETLRKSLKVKEASDSGDPETREKGQELMEGMTKGNKSVHKAHNELKEYKEEKEALEKGPIDKLFEQPKEEKEDEVSLPGSEPEPKVEEQDPLEDIDFEDPGKPEERVSLPKNSVKKLIQMTLMDFKDSKVTQVSPQAVNMIQEHGQSEMMRLALEGAKYARRDNRKTIKEEDIRRVLGIKAY